MHSTTSYKGWAISIQSVRHRHGTHGDTFSVDVTLHRPAGLQPEPSPQSLQQALQPEPLRKRYATVEAAEQAALQQARLAIDGLE